MKSTVSGRRCCAVAQKLGQLGHVDVFEKVELRAVAVASVF